MDNNMLHKVEPHRADAAADIVFVHGLGGDHRETWMARCDDDETYWPAWVANDLPTVNVWSLAYPSSPSAWVGDGVEFDTILDSLLDYLALMGIGRRPLVFVTHSLGGLVAKGILRAAREAADQRLQMLATNLRGVAFLATPCSRSCAAFAPTAPSWRG
jgi:triacylglycerol esterase/lipase EstA (alpha/beta hydrolase family)